MKRAILLSAFILLCVAYAHAQNFVDFRVPEHIVSPEDRGDTVILRLAAEYATVVQVEASWLSKPVPMYKNEGVWELKFTGLSNDIYYYRFIVDGVPALDPSNVNVQLLASGYRSFFVKDGPTTRYFAQAGRRGSVSYVWYESEILGSSRRMAVYTPYGYEMEENDDGKGRRIKKKPKQYPVLYLLHDEGGDEESWLEMGRLAQILDHLIEQGRAVPMIVVMPNCNPVEQASSRLGLPEIRNARTTSTSIFISSFINEIIPFVESHYSAIPEDYGRAACGIGTGGTTVINTAVMYPHIFDFLLPLSCGVKDNGNLTADFLRVKQGRVRLFWTGCGTADQEAAEASRVLHDALQHIHLDHTFYMMPGGRDWGVWRQFLITFSPMIFKYYTD